MVGLRIAIWSLCMAMCCGYSFYRDRIPNGYRVPHPCKDGITWDGVGHERQGGAGTRNVFGSDFFTNNVVWNVTLCNQDSDGDGRTNGEELGDPDCTWTPGDTPTYTTGLSHPGICEPFDSPLCDGRPSFVECDDMVIDNCNVLAEPETYNHTIRFTETAVPAKETTYACSTFAFPMDKDYHVVAYEPIITNIDVMHHTLLYGCEGVEEQPGELMKVVECGGEMSKCKSIIASWTAGQSGTKCYGDEFGFLVGKTGYKYAVMQHHWNNPERKTGYVDSSGMVLHMTPKLRPNNGDVLMIGQINLDIPPGVLSYSRSGVCTGQCTSQIMNGPIYISSTINHMHLLGHAQQTEYISGGVSRWLAKDDVYDYNTPITHVHEVPVQMNPGDELRTTCMFNSKSRNVTTRFGQGTNDEMCLAFLTYYPKENIQSPQCTAWNSLDFCEQRLQQVIEGCDFRKMVDLSNPETMKIYQSVSKLCSTKNCTEGCLNYVRTLKQHPCFTGDVGLYFRKTMIRRTEDGGKEFYGKVDSCDRVLALEEYNKDTNAGAIYRISIQIVMTSLTVTSLVVFLTLM